MNLVDRAVARRIGIGIALGIGFGIGFGIGLGIGIGRGVGLRNHHTISGSGLGSASLTVAFSWCLH